MLFALKNVEWEDEALKQFTDALNKTVFQMYKCPKGLIFHICDLYVEEIAKVADGELSDDRTHLLIEPFLLYYAKHNDETVFRHVEKSIIHQLMFQSELGQQYQEKFDIWKRANFPTKSIDELEVKYQVRGNKSLTDDDLSDGQEEDLEERSLDPRAGRVNVVLSEISFDALKFADTIETLRYKNFTSSKSRKGLARMANSFRRFAEDVFPLGVKSMPSTRLNDDEEAIDIDLKAIQLAEFEKKLAIGDVDSESSDVDEDLDNRKHGKLKRKSKETVTKSKEKKQKLSKLHNERFFKATEDFSQENSQQDEEGDDDEEDETKREQPAEMKIKKKKKKTATESDGAEEVPRKIKRKKEARTAKEETASVEANDEKPKKAMKLANPIESTSTTPFKETDEGWNEPLKEGEVEFFVPSKKQKLKALQLATTSSSSSSKKNLVLNPFAKSSEKIKTKGASSLEGPSSSFQTPPPRIRLSTAQDSPKSNGKRVIIALNKNIAQSEIEYIKQVKNSPNLPTNNLSMQPTKSLLKKNVNALPSPINPFYQKKLGFKKGF